MSSELTIDPRDPLPPYAQLRTQLIELIETGQLAADTRLPSLRQLAGDLGLAVGTVARVYTELEATGFVVSRRGGGTRVAAHHAALNETERRARLQRLAAAYVDRARALGFEADDIRAALPLELPTPQAG